MGNRLVLLFDENCPKWKDILCEGLQKQNQREKIFCQKSLSLIRKKSLWKHHFGNIFFYFFVTDSVRIRRMLAAPYDDVRFLSMMGVLHDQLVQQKPQKLLLQSKAVITQSLSLKNE